MRGVGGSVANLECKDQHRDRESRNYSDCTGKLVVSPSGIRMKHTGLRLAEHTGYPS